MRASTASVPQSTCLVSSPMPVLMVEQLTKHFDGVNALSGANLSVQPGELHALVGENGAGKSTLIKVLTGVHAANSGRVLLEGKPVKFQHTSDAQLAGVVALYQELAIVPNMSVAENIYLGRRPPGRAGIVSFRRLNEQSQERLAELGQVRLKPGRPASELTVIQQTMVAIARALAVDARLLILDEPTAALTEAEIAELFTTLRRLSARGVAVLYVSHRLKEVFELCTRVTVLRNGATAMTSAVADTSIDHIITAMIGRPQEALYPDRCLRPGDVALEARALTGTSVHDVNLDVRGGEILGIAGLGGSGRSQLLQLLAGVRPLKRGEVRLDGRQIHLRDVEQALRAGIAFVPEERRSQGLFPSDSIEDNIAIASLRQVSSFGGIVSKRKRAGLSSQYMEKLNIKATGPRQPVAELSGGNQQKVLLAKFLARSPRVLLLDEPTRGVDVGTRAEIYALVRQLADQGTAVILVSSELPEVIGISDRIVVMRDGQVAGEMPAATATDARLLAMFYGRESA